MSGKYSFEVLTSKDATSSTTTDFPEFLLGESSADAEDTFVSFSTYINNITGLYASASNWVIDKSDFFGEAVLALGKAKKDYNPKLGAFEPFAKFLIIDALNEYARHNRVLVNIPSYINKSNIIINRIKSRLSTFTDSPESLLHSDNYEKYGIPEEVANKVEKDKGLIRNAANRASISYEELLDRAEFLPVVEFENGDSTLDIAVEASYDKIMAKLVVDNIMPNLTDGEKLVAELLMDGKNKKEICKLLGRSDSWVVNRMLRIKKKILKI